jgi:hypothetical protein
MKIYIITGENGMFYGAYKTRKSIQNHFEMVKNELDAALKNYPHDLKRYCGQKFGKTIKTVEEVFCEDLGHILDELIELPADVTDKQYSEQVNKAVYKL